MKIGFGCDHAAIDLKNSMIAYMKEKGYECVDYGTNYDENGEIIKCDYPDKGREVGEAVVKGDVDYGVLMCGTGIGISISANKVPGVIAAVCSEPYSARMTKMHNNANIIAFGARVVGDEMAKMILDEFFGTEFEGGRHAGRVELIKKIEADYSK
ncbi:MAG: ribose 5-phosphate isomerase B [Lachnospiraceae bacterium]|jgi:ribose 5-phosphate isomerase B|nr:ribose 5-phosphate isomerase B [Lachnospiraceae bacterium]MCR5837265.1 ribose 5-phosphate isomerase B [Lachnospiraceae bacterium]